MYPISGNGSEEQGRRQVKKVRKYSQVEMLAKGNKASVT
jgi:hypothetical protein